MTGLPATLVLVDERSRAVDLGDAYQVLYVHLMNAESALTVAERDARNTPPGIRKVVALATMASLQGRVGYLRSVVDRLEHKRQVPELH